MEPKQQVKAPQKKLDYNYPKKPKRDPQVEGRDKHLKVICNLRQISLDQNRKKVTQYAIHYSPEIDEINYPLKRKIFRQLRGDLQGNFAKCFLSGDTLFVCDSKPKEKVTLETKVDDIEYTVTINLTSNSIDLRNIRTKERDNLKVKGFVESMIKHIIMANNHIVKFDDRSFFDYNDAEPFGRGGAKIWHGYSTAVCITENGLFLRINDKNKMLTGKTALDKIKEISRNYNGNLRSEDCIREIREYFKGRTLVAQYGNYRAYRIGDVTSERTVNNTEFNMNGKDGAQMKINVKNYYKNQYSITIKDEDQPLLIEEVQKRDEDNQTTRYLVPELMLLTGIDELDEKERADIIAKSKFQPSEKVKKIEKGLHYLFNKEKKIIRKKGQNPTELQSPDDVRLEWGINFGEHFVEVDARTLSVPQLEFQDAKESPQMKNGRFRQKRDINPINFNKENCMLITFNNIVNLAKGDCEQMGKAGKAFGINFDFPQLEKLSSNNKESLKEELKKINYNDGKKMCIVVLDRNTKSLYPLIKNYLYSQGGIPSQVMLHDENPRGGRKKQNMSYYSAVLNQMVVKAQGELFKINFCNGISSVPSMIVGIDSSKSKVGTKYVISASYNRSFNKFYTDMKVGKSPDDKPLKELLKSSIDYFKDINRNNKPKNILIYRQGGNEKQTEKLIRNELPQILELFNGKSAEGGYEDNYQPKLSIFSVNKKTDLKFFERGNRGDYRNIPTGTIIDQQVISPEVFEFYLQCPEVDKGTGSPVHFLCLYNTNEELTLNEFEEITYRQSFYYWNWPGPVRIPAALKYAEVANMFSTRNMTDEVVPRLKNCPYYI